MQNEIWLPVKGFEDLYEISSLGRLKSLRRQVLNRIHKEKILLCSVNVYGYVQASFSRDNVHKKVILHRIVAQHFVPNPDNRPEVNHKNGIKTDNRAENLEWCTNIENVRHAFNELGVSSGRKGKGGGQTNTARKTLCITTGEIFDCGKDACDKYGLHKNAVTQAIKKHNGYFAKANMHFRYLD